MTSVLPPSLPPHSSQFLQSLINAISDPLFVKDQQHRFMYVNEAFCKLLGHPATVLLNKSDYDFLPAEQADVFWEKDELVFSTGVTNENEEVITDASGQISIISTKKSLLHDEQGTPFLVGIIRDVTPYKRVEEELERRVAERTQQLSQLVQRLKREIYERQQTEQKLRQQEQFLRSIYDGVNAPIFVIDVEADNFYYAGWNATAALIAGSSSTEVAGKTPEEIFGELSGRIERQRLHACFEGGKSIQYEESIEFKGEMTWWLTTLNPIRNSAGAIDQIIGTALNITDHKLAEAKLQQQTRDLEMVLQELKRTQIQVIQSEKMSSLGQLVAGVAHEINNPLNFISGNLIYAQEYTQDLIRLIQLYKAHHPNPVPEIQTLIKAIDLEFLITDLPNLLHSMQVGADRIQQIVISLRNFSRMDESERKAVDIHDGIESTLMILQSRLKSKGNRPEIRVNREYAELPLVACYAGPLNQVFMNILSNAIDALEECFDQTNCDPEITIQTLMESRHTVKICIRDNGPGITPEVQQRLFDPFFTTKPVGKGTGMGLSISYQIVTEKHGGSLICRSTANQGSEFWITLPI